MQPKIIKPKLAVEKIFQYANGTLIRYDAYASTLPVGDQIGRLHVQLPAGFHVQKVKIDGDVWWWFEGIAATQYRHEALEAALVQELDLLFVGEASGINIYNAEDNFDETHYNYQG